MGLLFKELLPSPCLWTFNYIAWGADATISKNALVVATVNEFQHQIGAFVEFSCFSPPMFAGVFPINSSHELHQWSMNTSLCPEAKFPKTLWPICPPWVLCIIASTYNMFLKIYLKTNPIAFSVCDIYIYTFMDHPLWHVEIWPLCAIIRTASGTSLLQNQNSSSWLAQIDSRAGNHLGVLSFLSSQTTTAQLRKQKNKI